MKNLLFVFIFFPFLWSACDTVDGPYLQNPDALSSDVVLFEFTGMKCVYCPQGHRTMEQLVEIYGEKIHPIAVHCGSFAVPDADFLIDYRTPAGDDIYDEIQPDGFPSGMVNCMIYDSLVAPTAWATQIASKGNRLPAVIIRIDTTFDRSEINLHLEVQPIEALTGNYQLCAYLTEDKVVGKQKDGSELITNYVHNHMLRATFGETWGKTVQLVDNIEFDAKLTMNTDWNVANLHVIPFLLNENSYEILPADIIFTE